jgi:hypothetical protein
MKKLLLLLILFLNFSAKGFDLNKDIPKNSAAYKLLFSNKKEESSDKKSVVTRSSNSLPEEIIHLNWNGNAWDTIRKENIQYVTGLPLVYQIIMMNYSISGYQNESRTTYTYNADGIKTLEINEMWVGSSWNNSSKIETNYDSNKNLTEEIYSDWTGSDWEIIYGYKNEYTYNADNKILSTTLLMFENGIWVESSLEINTYDANGHLSTTTVQEWNGTIWNNSFKQTFTNNNNGEFTQLLMEMWDEDTNDWSAWIRISNITWYNFSLDKPSGYVIDFHFMGIWMAFTRATISYNTNHDPLIELNEENTGTSWQNSDRTVYLYDAQFNLTNLTNEIWENSQWVIEYGNKTTYTYDSGNRITSAENEEYYSGNWVKTDKQLYKYSQSISVKNAYASSEVKLYPNPVNDKLNINLSGNENANISVFDMTGKKVADFNITSHSSVDLSGLQTGAYIVQIKTNDTLTTRRLIKK